MNEQENIRPWGRYDVLDVGEGYQVKRIVVNPQGRLSYQRHAHRAERWTIVQGMATVTLDDVVTTYAVGDVVVVPVMAKHRIANTQDTLLMFIEVQIGDYLGEDDIERFSDDYGRAAPTVSS